MNYKGVKNKTYTCAVCEAAFKINDYRRKEPTYCSRKCQLIKRRELHNKDFEQGKVTWTKVQRKFLIERNGYKCESCNISEWQNKPLTLQVDHIDGNPGNNMPSNLRLLCPNCHSQTPTYKGGNKKNLKMDPRSVRIRENYGARSRNRT